MKPIIKPIRPMTQTTFEVYFQNQWVKGDRFEGDCEAIVLHGAGNSSRQRFIAFRNSLNNKGLPTVSFDFIGHGETGGTLFSTSLQLREELALKVIREQLARPSTLIGSSMSGYTAIKLTQIMPVKNLILMVPGIYTPTAYSVKFGPDFSKIIRTTDSWLDSDAFEILQSFTGNVLIIAAQHDTVIPIKLIERLYQSSSRAKSRQLYTVSGATHKELLTIEPEFNTITTMIVNKVLDS